MSKYSVEHETDCPSCGADLTQSDSISVHISAGGHEFDILSSVDTDGLLQDTDDRVIASGFHAGSNCNECDEQLDELLADQWYVRFEATGEIAGPMTKDKALSTVDGMAFSENIFSPRFVTTPEVEKILRQLQSMEENDPPGKSLLQAIIDTITLLSAKKVVTGTIEGGVLSLDDVPDGVDVEINDYDVSGDEENLEEDSGGRTFAACRWGA